MTTLTGAALFSLRNAIIGEISSLIQASDASFNSNQKLEAFRLAIEASNTLTNSNFLENKLLTFFPLKNTDNRIKKVLYQSHGQNLLRNKLERHTNEVTNAEFSPDGEYIVTSSSDATAKLWTKNGKFMANLNGHKEMVNSAKFSPDGEYILTSSFDTTAKLWTKTGDLLTTITDPKDSYGVNRAEFSSDGKYILTSLGSSTATVWSTAELLKSKQNFDTTPVATIGTYNHDRTYQRQATFSPDGKYIITVSQVNNPSENTSEIITEIWAVDGKLISTIEGSGKYSSDGRFILTSSSDSTARLWERNGELVTIYEAHEMEVNQAKFSPDGNFILTTSSPDFRSNPDNRSNPYNAYDGTAKVWQRDETLVATIGDSSYTVGSAKFSPDGRWVVTASSANNLSNNNNARVWSTNGSLLAILKDTRLLDNSADNSIPTVDAEFSPSGEYIVTAALDGTIKIWSTAIIDSQEETVPIASFKSHSERVFDVKFSSDGTYFVTASADTTAKIWNMTKILQNQVAPISILRGHQRQLESAKFSTDGKFIITDSFDGTVKIWTVDEEKGRGNLFATLDTYNGIPKSAQMSSDGNSIVTISFNGKARLWDLRLDSMTTQGCKELENYLKSNFNSNSHNRAICEGILSDND